jgi:hypothetical protein
MTLPSSIGEPLGLAMITLGIANIFMWHLGGIYTNGALIGTGVAILAFGPSQAEKNGYRFQPIHKKPASAKKPGRRNACRAMLQEKPIRSGQQLQPRRRRSPNAPSPSSAKLPGAGTTKT